MSETGCQNENQHTQLIHKSHMKTKMMNPLRIRIMSLPLVMKMTNPLCGQHQEKDLRRKGVTQLLVTEALHLWFLQDHLQMHQCEGERDRKLHFSTPPQYRVDVLETGDVPILFTLSQLKKLGMPIQLDPREDPITCPAFGLHAKWRERSARTFALSERKKIGRQLVHSGENRKSTRC